MEVDSRIPPGAETHINDSLIPNIVNPAEFSDTSSVTLNLKNRSPAEKLDINEMSMPLKIKRIGKPKGTETTVVWIP